MPSSLIYFGGVYVINYNKKNPKSYKVYNYYIAVKFPIYNKAGHGNLNVLWSVQIMYIILSIILTCSVIIMSISK